MKLFTRFLLFACLSLPVVPQTALGCPLCKAIIPEASDGTEGDHDPERLSRAYNYSIFGMLAIMFSLLGGVGFMIYRTQRSAYPLDQSSTAPLPRDGSGL